MKVLCLIKASAGAAWLVTQASAFKDRGHDVAVILPSADDPLAAQLGLRGIRVIAAPAGIAPGRGFRIVLDVLRVRSLIRSERPHVLFYQLWASAIMGRIASLGVGGLRRVHMIPGPLFLESAGLRWVERLLVRRDHLVLAASRYTAAKYLEMGVPADRLIEIPYGVDVERFRPASASERRRMRAAMGIPAGAFVVTMVSLVYGGKRSVFGGRPIKGHRDLLEAWAALELGTRPRHLLLVGGGFDAGGRKHREQLLRDYGVDSNPTVSWLATVEDVRPYYVASDLSVSPSLSDNHGAAVEASAMGVPSIVSDAGALSEVVVGSGWVFTAGNVAELRERLREAASLDENELDRRRIACRRHVEMHFDAAKSNDRLVTTLENVAESLA